MEDLAYLSLRAKQELVAAMGAHDRRVRDLHLELADAYSFRLREMRAMACRSNFMLIDAA